MNTLKRFDLSGEDHFTWYAGRLPIRQGINLGIAGMVAFSGCSMKPTLVDGDLVEVLPYDQRTIQVGDIIYYQLPAATKAIIHRVIRITPAGVIARGDHNPFDDAAPIPSEFIFGQVIAVWRGSRRRKIAGGRRGMISYRFHQIILACESAIVPILKPFYQLLVRREVIARCLPQKFRPKVIEFGDSKETRLRLIWWQRVIGEYDFHQRRWNIDRPFRLLFSECAICFNKSLQGCVTSPDNHHLHYN